MNRSTNKRNVYWKWRMAMVLGVLAVLPWLPRSVAAAEPVRTLTIHERFGVSHPTQVIDFDLNPPITGEVADAVHVQGSDGHAVPFQWLERGRRLAVQTDLPAGAQRIWHILHGAASHETPTDLQVLEKADCYEIVNSLVGVRIPREGASLDPAPAPLQAIRLADGRWMNATRVPLLRAPPQTLEVRFAERGPLRVVVEIAYTFARPDLTYGQDVLIPGGPGHYTARICLAAGSPSIVIEEDADTDVAYELDFYAACQPNQARYQGHHATSVQAGREQDGRQYRMWHDRTNCDALVDLQYQTPWAPPFLARWDPWIYDSGWYWQFYNTRGPASSPLVGIFAGRASRIIGAAASGVRVLTRPATDADQPFAGLRIECNRRSPDGRVFPRVRFQWGLFVGTRADLAPPDQVQKICRQMNLHGGFNLNKVLRYELDYPDPPQGYGAMFMPRDALRRMVDRLRADTQGIHGAGFHHYLYTQDPYARPLVDFWFDPSPERIERVATDIADLARDILDAFVNGQGIMDFRYHYWHGGLRLTNMAAWIDQLLASDQVSSEQRSAAKAAAALLAYILWDDDFVPLFPGHGLNLGNPNMPVNQNNARALIALLLAGHPAMKTHADAVQRAALDDLRGTINEYGAHMGSVHYVGAAAFPLVGAFQQLQMTGRYDAFEREPRLARFAEFYLNFLTPPEVRFGGLRKLVAIGDGSTEGTSMYGQLATGFARARPELSRRLMAAWRDGGNVHGSFQGTSYLKIDESLPGADPELGAAAFPGWCAVLRSGWNTPRETAIWLTGGEDYRDHRHNDNGGVVIYALGAPLSIDWGSMYSPHVPGGFLHSLVLPESAIGHRWDQGDVPLDVGGRWIARDDDPIRVDAATNSAHARFRLGDDLEWRRTVRLSHVGPEIPLIEIRDEFAGTLAATPKILSFNLMATGPVAAPGGELVPPPRTHARQPHVEGEPGHELPSAGSVVARPPGVTRLGFVGQTWQAHPTGGIDFDVYLAADGDTRMHIGNWAHLWHPSTEESQFRAANQAERFEESQHILRVRGTGAFRTLIVPWCKGRKPADLTVRREANAWIVTTAQQSARLDRLP